MVGTAFRRRGGVGHTLVWVDDETALQAARTEACAQVDALSADLAGLFAASESVATDDEHDPEGHTIAYERAQLTALLARARERVAELDLALERLRQGSYGVCERCGRPIPAERLEIRPAARTCVTCV
jgi:RNA polymerase-binding transcription factor DksA